MKRLVGTLALGAVLLGSAPAMAQNANIAVAANFTKTIEEIGRAFTQETGHSVKFAFGPSGKLFAQIKNGAPFDAFFSADEMRAQKVAEEGLGEKRSYFVYAQGQIALYSAHYPVANEPLEVLKKAQFNHLAIANPKTAPYGERAEAYLKKVGVYEGVKGKLVNGESIAHAFQYVVTQNAEIGFVALSQLVDPQSPVYQKGEYWIVPQSEYKPINQGAILTNRGANNPAATAFMEFVKTPKAIEIIQRYGYNVQ